MRMRTRRPIVNIGSLGPIEILTIAATIAVILVLIYIRIRLARKREHQDKILTLAEAVSRRIRGRK